MRATSPRKLKSTNNNSHGRRGLVTRPSPSDARRRALHRQSRLELLQLARARNVGAHRRRRRRAAESSGEQWSAEKGGSVRPVLTLQKRACRAPTRTTGPASRAGSAAGYSRQHVGAAGLRLLARPARPDADHLALDRVLAAEGARVLRSRGAEEGGEETRAGVSLLWFLLRCIDACRQQEAAVRRRGAVSRSSDAGRQEKPHQGEHCPATRRRRQQAGERCRCCRRRRRV